MSADYSQHVEFALLSWKCSSSNFFLLFFPTSIDSVLLMFVWLDYNKKVLEEHDPVIWTNEWSSRTATKWLLVRLFCQLLFELSLLLKGKRLLWFGLWRFLGWLQSSLCSPLILWELRLCQEERFSGWIIYASWHTEQNSARFSLPTRNDEKNIKSFNTASSSPSFWIESSLSSGPAAPHLTTRFRFHFNWWNEFISGL